MKKHSKYSPSSAYRWTECPGSLQFPQESTNKWAEEGNIAHALSANILNGKKNFSLKTPPEMLNAVNFYVEYVSNIPGERFIEQKVALNDEFFGTADCIILQPWSTLHIIDFKYGTNPVEVENNKQLIMYALCALNTLHGAGDVDLCTLHIIQPRSVDGIQAKQTSYPIQDFWPISEKYYDETFIAYFERKIQEAKEYPHKYVPGTWCKWCPGINVCPTVKTGIELRRGCSIETLDSATLSALLNLETAILDRLNQAKQEAFNRLFKGDDEVLARHFKLVQSLGNRKWKDPEAVEKRFGAEAMEHILMSPAKLEKGRSKEERQWIKDKVCRESKLKLVPISNKKPAFNIQETLKEV